MLDHCCSAHKLYKAAVQERKQIKEREEKMRVVQIEDERQQEEIKVQEKLEKVNGLEKQNKEIDSQM